MACVQFLRTAELELMYFGSLIGKNQGPWSILQTEGAKKFGGLNMLKTTSSAFLFGLKYIFKIIGGLKPL